MDAGDLRIVEEDVELMFLAKELFCGALDGRQVCQVESQEDGFFSRFFLEARDGCLGFGLISRGEVDLCVVFETDSCCLFS